MRREVEKSCAELHGLNDDELQDIGMARGEIDQSCRTAASFGKVRDRPDFRYGSIASV
jgi:hypothetical protein